MNTTAHLHMPDTKASWKQCLRIVMALLTVIVTAQPAIAQWEVVRSSLGATAGFLVSGRTILGGIGPAGLLRSLDDGKNWERVDGPINDEVVTCLYDNGHALFCGTYVGLHVSTDSGRTWARTDSGVDMRFINSMTSINSHLLVAQGTGSLTPKMYCSTDDGKSWDRALFNITPGQPVSPLVRAGSLLLGLYHSSIILSRDTGRTWTDTGMRRCEHICATDSLFVCAKVNSIQFSTDEGATWDERITGIPLDFVGSSIAATGDTVFAVVHRYFPSDSSMVFVSTNAGMEWKPVFQRWDVGGVFVHGGYLYLICSDAFRRRSIHELITAAVPPRPAPGSALRLEVHPNPSDGRVTLSWTSPAYSERATVLVYDIFGRVAVSEEIDARESGEGSITLDALDLAPGAYLLVLTIGIQQATVLHQILKQH